MVDSDEQHGRGPGCRDQPHHQIEVTLRQREADAAAHTLIGAAQEARALAFLLAERLDHAQRSQRFVHDGQRGALELPRLARLPAQPGSIEPGRQEQRRRHGQGHDRQLPIQPQHHVDHADEGGGRAYRGDETLDDDLLEGRGIVLNPVHGVRRARRVMIRQRQPLEMAKHRTAELQDERFAGRGGEVLLP